MGNKFKISNMMPSSWYSKLKQMNKPNTTNKTHPLNINPLPVEPFVHNRPSNYIPSCSPLHPKAIDTHFPLDSPRKSDKIHRKLPNVVTSPKLISTSKLDQFNDVNVAFDNGVDIAFELPKIITKSTRKEEEEEEAEFSTCYSYRKIKARANSPKVKVVQRSMKQRKCAYFSKSFVMIKNSSDPKEDFRQSMMEMIVENELKGAKDLEELLACYLCLNSSEYHHVIVQAFEEIWFDAKLNKTVKV